MQKLQIMFIVIVVILVLGYLSLNMQYTKNHVSALWKGVFRIYRTATAQNEKKTPEFPVSSVKPNILERQRWNANTPIEKMQEHTPRYITIHHTASPQNPKVSIEQKMRNLQHFSQHSTQLASGRLKPAWPDVPYHFYIDVNGQIAEGRDIRFSGDTNTSYDPTGHIQIVLEGNFEQEYPSFEQLQSLNQLTLWLTLRWGIHPSEVKGHNDYASTACPGKNLESSLSTLREEITNRVLLNQEIQVQKSITSEYTSLLPERCKTIEIDTTSATSVQVCDGVGGYSLLVHDSDGRVSVVVVDPTEKEHPLNLWAVVSDSFSYIGDTAEWRVIKEKEGISPIGLVIKFNVYEDPTNPTQVTSYFIISKITQNTICITNKVKLTIHEEILNLVDNSMHKSCLE